MKFSESGKEQAAQCGFPDELAADGHYGHWSAKYCCENLLKMADLDTTGSAIVRKMSEERRRSDADSRDKPLLQVQEIPDSGSE